VDLYIQTPHKTGTTSPYLSLSSVITDAVEPLLRQRRPEHNSKADSVGFLVNKVALGQVSSPDSLVLFYNHFNSA
jgi:hypothetical protein